MARAIVAGSGVLPDPAAATGTVVSVMLNSALLLSCRWVCDVKSESATWLDGAVSENVPSNADPKIVVAPV